MTNIVQSTWHCVVRDPDDPLEALRAVQSALESGRQIPKEYRAWLSRGIAGFLKSPDGGLDRALGIKPKVGQRSLANTHSRGQRDDLYITIADTLPRSSISAMATGVAQIVERKIAPNPAAEKALRLLLDHHRDQLVSAASIYNTLARVKRS